MEKITLSYPIEQRGSSLGFELYSPGLVRQRLQSGKYDQAIRKAEYRWRGSIVFPIMNDGDRDVDSRLLHESLHRLQQPGVYADVDWRYLTVRTPVRRPVWKGTVSRVASDGTYHLTAAADSEAGADVRTGDWLYATPAQGSTGKQGLVMAGIVGGSAGARTLAYTTPNKALKANDAIQTAVNVPIFLPFDNDSAVATTTFPFSYGRITVDWEEVLP